MWRPVTHVLAISLALWSHLLVSVESSTSLSANFNMGGVTGTIQFDQVSAGTSTTITVSLNGLLAGTYMWEIRELPVFYDRFSKCADPVMGAVLHDLDATHSGLTSSTPDGYQVTDNSIDLSGIDSISGRSVVLDSGSHRVCATISTSETLVTATVLFQAPVAGMVMLRQPASDSSAETTVYSDLFFIDGMTGGSAYDWSIYSNLNGIDYDITHTARCAAVTSVYNPTSSDNTGCTSSAQENCQVGNLSANGDVEVGTNKGDAVKQSVDTNLPLSGANSVIGHTVVIMSGGEKLACGYITELESRTVEAVFSSENVNGSISFTQASPLDPTTVSVSLSNLQDTGKFYHVHNFPLPPRTTESDDLCSGFSVSGHWNPYGIDQDSSPTPGTGTMDKYEIGDLSGKFGPLSGDDFSETYSDYNLPIFGKHSIAGRSIVIHKPDGSRWICASISYPAATKTAVAVFRGPIVGYMMLRQASDDPFSETSVFVNLADGSTATNSHNWHIHEDPVTDDFLSSTSRCSSAGPHYNPYAASLDEPAYSSECNSDNPFRCELGDLSSKHSQIDIVSDLATSGGKFFFTDTQAPLSGITSSIGRSIVVHAADSGASRYACANIYELKPVVARAGSWSEGPVSGTIDITQNSWLDSSEIDIAISGLQSLAKGYHIHALPILSSAESPCSGASVLGHFNPFNVIGSPDTGTHDMYEVGDLSGKFGNLAELSSLTTTYTDSNLPMMGPQSANDRSIVIHRNDEIGSRWVCSNLISVLAAGDFEVEVVVTMDTASLSGTVVMKKIYYEGGFLGDTTILADLTLEEGEGVPYSWSVYSGYSETADCDGIGEVYNPYQVETGGSYDSICSLSYQSHCQVGDLTGRYGNLSPEDGRARYTDINLPLIGESSVIGRTIKVTASGGSGGSCVTLLPTEETGARVSLGFATLEDTFDQYNFRQTVAAFVGVDMSRVVASREPVTSVSDCQTIAFWFIGPNSANLRNNFITAATSENNENLGVYAPTDYCPMEYSDVSSASYLTASLVLLNLAFLITLL
ncbi:LOW QUALITY PROTEIN: uncharacterized protein [Ptychodera flava]|uniref:LOW QUALITY PROTEIN: uncharacterized protein n=1 Tax=Ptychodera flava TaxID=63121 RepID=UPI00396A7579